MTHPTLVLTILTGQRCDYLKETIRTLLNHGSSVVEDAFVIVLVNGADASTVEFVNTLKWVDQRIDRPVSDVLPIGAAISELHRQATKTGCTYWMHLEDDWRCVGPNWRLHATQILDADSRIGQVRMRHVGDRVRGRHMITQAPIRWMPKTSRYKVADAHFTFNPSLVRLADVSTVFPCGNELEAMENFVQGGKLVGQLTPGCFTHIGEHSRRIERQRKM